MKEKNMRLPLATSIVALMLVTSSNAENSKFRVGEFKCEFFLEIVDSQESSEDNFLPLMFHAFFEGYFRGAQESERFDYELYTRLAEGICRITPKISLRMAAFEALDAMRHARSRRE